MVDIGLQLIHFLAALVAELPIESSDLLAFPCAFSKPETSASMS
jgi:hypothetical protein